MKRPTRRHTFLTVAAVVVALALWSGCASTVRPPADVADPARVYLLSSGRHAGLVFTRDDGRAVEYGYGDWGWYALCRDDWWRVPATVFWPNEGTLGRRDVPAWRISTAPGAYDGGTLTPLAVPRAAAERLLARLDGEFAAAGEPHFNAVYDMSFVRHPDCFWMFHLCHDEAAEWLGELGCDVGWAPVRTGLRVATPEE